MLRPWAPAALLALLCGYSMSGQTASGTLAGVVRDASGAPIAGAHIKVTSSNTGAARDASTDIEGSFRVPNLPPDTYEITISKESFRTRQEWDIRVDAGRTVSLALHLDLGSVSETVDVSAKN